MPNYTRTGLKMSGNRSYGGMNPPQSPDLNIIEAVWDHPDREQHKRKLVRMVQTLFLARFAKL